MPRPLLSVSFRCAIAAALVLALGLAACGRKGDLDPPPGRFADPRATDAQPAPGPDGQVAVAPGPNVPPAAQPAKKTTPLDWLLN